MLWTIIAVGTLASCLVAYIAYDTYTTMAFLNALLDATAKDPSRKKTLIGIKNALIIIGAPLLVIALFVLALVK